MPSGERKLKRRLGGGNEAEEVQTPDVEFDKNCFNVEFNKTVYVRIAREREREIRHWGKCLTKTASIWTYTGGEDSQLRNKKLQIFDGILFDLSFCEPFFELAKPLIN